MKPRPAEFNWRAALAQAESIRSAPPAKAHIKRPELLHTVVFQAVIPASLCLEANKMMRRAFATEGWMHADSSKRLWDHLKEQAKLWLKYKPWWPIELEHGRPQVVATKFSPRSPDVGSNPAKKAIDMLTPPRWTNRAEHKFTKHRLGVIKDDRPECVEQVHHWEHLPAEYPAFILLEVRI